MLSQYQVKNLMFSTAQYKFWNRLFCFTAIPTKTATAGPYTTKACTNCQQIHARCSGEATCKRYTQHNLVCTFNESGKKRGPKKNGKHLEQVYVFNSPENDFDGTSMLSSVIPNPEQGYTSTLSFPSEYLQRQPDNFGVAIN
ncbi:hypothetical protein C2G38_2036914 [Gigaspora rosea]|uniref:Zn(2)-C6 fungal-type domain-containing protein n=1 Tax=Gigaspora rosea TaxID=44941 RepID=A0A397V7R0_9GLOM|nr:hypothetical protein C2G38_2036914 [Gigaspora rosea]